MKEIDKIFELIKANSFNEDYVIGNALIELYPIDQIVNSDLGNSNVKICYENNPKNRMEIINSILHVITLAEDNEVILSKTHDYAKIGGIGLMRIRTGSEYIEELITMFGNYFVAIIQ